MIIQIDCDAYLTKIIEKATENRNGRFPDDYFFYHCLGLNTMKMHYEIEVLKDGCITD